MTKNPKKMNLFVYQNMYLRDVFDIIGSKLDPVEKGENIEGYSMGKPMNEVDK